LVLAVLLEVGEVIVAVILCQLSRRGDWIFYQHRTEGVDESPASEHLRVVSLAGCYLPSSVFLVDSEESTTAGVEVDVLVHRVVKILATPADILNPTGVSGNLRDFLFKLVHGGFLFSMCVSSVIITDGSLFVNFPSDAYALPYFRAVVFLVTCVKCALLPYRNGAEISKLDRSRQKVHSKKKPRNGALKRKSAFGFIRMTLQSKYLLQDSFCLRMNGLLQEYSHIQCIRI